MLQEGRRELKFEVASEVGWMVVIFRQIAAVWETIGIFGKAKLPDEMRREEARMNVLANPLIEPQHCYDTDATKSV
jgi:hypothetical protein